MFINKLALDLEFVIALALGASAGLALLLASPLHKRTAITSWVALAAFTLVGAFSRLALVAKMARPAAILQGIADLGVVAVSLHALIAVLFRLVLPKVGLRTARIVEDLSSTGALITWIIIWLHGQGVEPGSLVTTSAILTATAAFAMQETLGNVLGGIVLQLDHSLNVGDWVKVDDVSGKVVEIRWRHTAVRTRNNETVMVPNAWLLKNRFTVIGASSDPDTAWRRWIWFPINVQHEPAEVIEAMEEAVTHADIANVLKSPAPDAVLMEVHAGYARYALRYWMSNPRHDDPTDSQVRSHVMAALARHGIELGVPSEERLISKDNENRAAWLHDEQIKRNMRALKGVDIFHPLEDEELRQLAEHLVATPFARGDIITRQGAAAHWLYVLAKGRVELWAERDDGRTHITSIDAGGVFGEMSLMTGEPRRATVQAATDVMCLRLNKLDFERIIRQRPDIAEEMAKILSTRMQQLDEAHRAAHVLPPKQGGGDVVDRIRQFFGLPPAPSARETRTGR